jgi:hypothetical protein
VSDLGTALFLPITTKGQEKPQSVKIYHKISVLDNPNCLNLKGKKSKLQISVLSKN